MAERLRDIFSLTNRVAVVTGGYGYLGATMVRALAAFDAKVVVAGRSEETFLRVFTSAERKIISFHHLNITDSESVNQCINKVIEIFGHIDILVNNAHAAKGQSPDNMSDDDWTYTMEGVVGSVHKCIRAVIPHMKKHGSGKIINTASMYGIVSPDLSIYKGENCEIYLNPPHYGAAKAAMIQLTKYYAVLLGDSNIQVNAISPGPFPNASVQRGNKAFIERLKNHNPLHKIGGPEDLAGALILLSSNASDFMTGQNIQVDGGWTIW